MAKKRFKAEAPKRGVPAIHPGEFLREDVLPELKAAGISKVAMAAALGIARPTLEDIVRCNKPVTPQMALRLGKYLGMDPDIWVRLQSAWDLERAAEAYAPELEAIVPAKLDKAA